MKIVIPATLLTIGVLLVFSCKKDHRNTTKPDAKLYTMTFNMGDQLSKIFVQSKLTTNSTDTPLTQKIKTLTFLVYNSQGVLKNQITQDSTFSNFGSVTDQEPSGTYYVYFLGNASGSGAVNLSQASFQNRFSQTDLFYKADTVVINGTNVDQNVSLSRINSLLELDIQDAVPTTISGIDINDGTGGGIISLKDTSVFKACSCAIFNEIYHGFTAAEKGTANVKIQMRTYMPQAQHTVTLTVYGPNNTPIGTPVVVKNVKFLANAKTTLTGTVFDKTSNNDNNFHISIDTGWNSTTINR